MKTLALVELTKKKFTKKRSFRIPFLRDEESHELKNILSDCFVPLNDDNERMTINLIINN